MNFSIFLTAAAELDLFELYRYVARHDAPAQADHLLSAIERESDRLDTMPTRGHYSPELERIGVLDFREVFFKPYRIIYEVRGIQVVVHCVLDGRRDMIDLLQERLLR